MAIDMVVQSLLRVDLFRGLKPLQLAELARRSDRIVYKAGDAIISEGAAGDAAVLIVSGDAVRTSGPLHTADVEPVPDGSLLGEMAMLIETDYTSTVIARSMTRAVRITRQAVLTQITADASLADHLSQKLVSRLHAVSLQLQEIDDAFARTDHSFMSTLGQASPQQLSHLHQLH